MKMELTYEIISATQRVDRDPDTILAHETVVGSGLLNPGFIFEKGKDRVCFLGDTVDAAIQYGATSPFTGANEPQANTVFPIGNTKMGPFKVNRGGYHHFQCGTHTAAGGFVAYATGDDTPVEP